MIKRLVTIILMLCLVTGLFGCSGSAPASSKASSPGNTSAPGNTSSSGNSETFKLGCFLPLTGNVANAAADAKNAIDLAVSHINANGGLNGSPVEMVYYDTQLNAEEAVKIATKLTDVDKVTAVIGSFQSGEVLACASYYNGAGVYLIGLGTAASWMVEDLPYVFRGSANNNSTTPFAAQMALDIGAKTVAIFNTPDDSGITTADSFVEACSAVGIEVLTRQQSDVSDTDYSAQIAAIVSANPDIVYMSCVGDVNGPFVRQLRQGGYNGVILSKEPLATYMAEIAGVENSDYVAYAYPYVTYTDIADCDIPIMADYLKIYQEAYGTLPPSDCGYRAWDSMMILWKAAQIAGSNEPEALKNATNTIVMEGLGGTIDFTSGNREAYSKGFNGFILVDGVNLLWSDWIANGGFDTYKEATSRNS